MNEEPRIESADVYEPPLPREVDTFADLARDTIHGIPEDSSGAKAAR
ncbi:hypothetical protein [Embleya sp. NPDC001921]